MTDETFITHHLGRWIKDLEQSASIQEGNIANLEEELNRARASSRRCRAEAEQVTGLLKSLLGG